MDTERELQDHRAAEADKYRGDAYGKAGITSGWKSSTWLWTIAGLSAAVLVIAGFLVPFQVQAGYVLFSLAFCGVALAAVILLMTSLRSRRGHDEQLTPSP
jgi:hypothetical protein